MLDGLRQFIADIVAPSADPDLAFDDTGYRLAATALLVHVVSLDGEPSAVEKRKLHSLIESRFKLDPGKATAAELRGQEVFFGKGQCSACHVPPFYTDNLMHNLQVERFFKPQMVNGRFATADGPIKTFSLRGIKDSPPYLHDGRLLTLDDTVEFFNLVLGTKLTDQEKQDLVQFLRTL